MFLQLRFRRRAGTAVAGAVLWVAVLITTVASARSEAATPLNAQASLGINTVAVNYYSPEQPFLNIFKTEGISQGTPADGWITHSNSTWDTREEAYLQLDSNGYPTTLTASGADPHSPQQFNSVGVLLLRSLANANAGTGLPYRPGKYVVLYDGQGTIVYNFDAKLVSSSPGRDVIRVVTPTTGGIELRIAATDPNRTGNYIRNIRVVKAEEESLLDAGFVFRPGYLRTLQNFRVLRLMGWLEIDDSGGPVTNWSSRPRPSDGGWGSSHGVPIEIAVQLCNAVGTDCWLNVPHAANDDYITRMAQLVHSSLGSNQKVYIEFSNEVWNSGYRQYSYATAQGRAMWPDAAVSPFEYNRSWFGMRTAQMCDIWKSTWGPDASRVVCVLGAQAANPWTATESLNCPLWTGSGNAPCSNHNINAVAIAPYFGGAVPTAWASDGSDGIASLFESMTIQNDPSIPAGGWLGQLSAFEAAYHLALAPYKLPYIGYEGGQTFTGFPTYQNGSSMVHLFIEANRDPRMAAAYTTALHNWKANGGQLWVLFADISQPNNYGEWGAIESFMDTVYPLSKAPPKWQAIQGFNAQNACWWPGCNGSVARATTPMPPADVQATQ